MFITHDVDDMVNLNSNIKLEESRSTLQVWKCRNSTLYTYKAYCLFLNRKHIFITKLNDTFKYLFVCLFVCLFCLS